MKYYLCSFKPLVSTEQGQKAIRQHRQLHPFIDGSCRREPDFDLPYPSISALCRGKLFAPNLSEGDVVVYLTTKGHYLGEEHGHWRLVAILRVIKKFQTHEDAATWYKEKADRLPSNCMVAGNPPIPFNETHGRVPRKLKDKIGKWRDVALVGAWDIGYRSRARLSPEFLGCRPMYLELDNPPSLFPLDCCVLAFLT